MLYVGLYLLSLTRFHPLPHRLGILFFVMTAVTLYSLSGLYHGVQHRSEETKRIWQLLDQSAIFWLIVGSNVPIAIYILPTKMRNLLLGGMIALATAGTLSLWLLPVPPYLLLITLYVGLGIVSLIPLPTYYQRLGGVGLFWIFLLAFGYIGGAACEAIKWPTLIPEMIGPHEMLHFGDILGTLAHLTLLVKYVLPKVNVHITQHEV